MSQNTQIYEIYYGYATTAVPLNQKIYEAEEWLPQMNVAG